jgi:hypothetical protein
MIADLHGTLTYFNKSSFTMFGHRDESEILGKPFPGYPPAGQKKPGQCRRSGIKSCQRNPGGEMRGCRKNRTSIDIHLSSNFVHDATGAPLCVIMNFTDVSW